MHYGRLMFAFLHQADVINSAYKKFPTMFCTDWKQVSASQQQDTKFTVPYAHVKDRMTISDEPIDLWTLFCWVAVPLQNYSTATPPSVGVSVFARFVDLQLAGYIPDGPTAAANVSNIFQPQMKSMINEKEKSLKGMQVKGNGQGKESHEKSALNEVGDFVDDAVGVVSRIAKGVSTGANSVMGAVSSVMGVAKFFGLSVPPNSTSTNPMQISMPKWSYYEDLPLTNVLGNNTMDQVKYDELKVSGTELENVILHYLMRPCLLTTRQVTAAMTPGTNVYQLYINPLYTSYTSDLIPFDERDLYPLPLSYVSRMFKLWRGSMRFHLSIVASRFHACRLRILYIPIWNSTAINLDPAQHCVNMVIDVTEETEVS